MTSMVEHFRELDLNDSKIGSSANVAAHLLSYPDADQRAALVPETTGGMDTSSVTK